MKTNQPTALEIVQAVKLKKICPSLECERQIVCQNEFGHDPRYLFLEDGYLLEKVGLAKFKGESGTPSIGKFDDYSCWIVGCLPIDLECWTYVLDNNPEQYSKFLKLVDYFRGKNEGRNEAFRQALIKLKEEE